MDIPLNLTNLSEEHQKLTLKFWKSLWNDYVYGNSTSLPYWSERYNNPAVFNSILIALGKHIVSSAIPERNWGEVKLNEEHLEAILGGDELENYKFRVKFKKYVPREEIHMREETLTKTPQGLADTGLIRNGFKAAAATQYYYDTYYLDKYKDSIIRNTNKGMSKVRELYPMERHASDYDEVSTSIVEDYLADPYIMVQEDAYADSRGRAIMKSLKRVANPIGFKDFRALMCIPE